MTTTDDEIINPAMLAALSRTTAVGPVPTTIEGELRSEVTVSVPRAAQVLGVSRSYGYQLVALGELPVIRLGAKRVRVPTVALRRMLGIED